MEFTEEEVRDKLSQLGYHDVPRSKLIDFMADLEELIQLDLSSACTSSTSTLTNEEDVSHGADALIGNDSALQTDSAIRPSRKAFAKDRVRSTSHHISFDKENVSVFDREDMPVFDSTHDTLSSTLLTGEDGDETLKRRPPDHTVSGMKRKVVRKRGGSSRVFDESVTSNDDESVLSDITDIEDKIRNLPVSEDTSRLTGNNASRPSTASSYRKQQRSKSASSIQSSLLSENSCGGVLPSFIRQSHTHPHTRNLMKCDPVSRFHQFNKEWQRGSGVPGEKGHSSLRWNVRERMLHCEVFEKPRRQHAVNDYVVPTEKKRQALRWKVRSAMANVK